MSAEYQEPDWRVVDYQAFCLDPQVLDVSRNCPLRIRGPRPASLERGGYFVCLGGAQTFGRFCLRPFPTLLQERLAMPVLNISYGGAGPSFFSRNHDRLFDWLNGARFVVLQVMSGRSESNSLFESSGVGHYRRRSDGGEIGSDAAFSELLARAPRPLLERLVAETRRNWIASYQALLARIDVPTILFWFSTRRPDYRQSHASLQGLFGAFPQLVDGAMLRPLRARCGWYVSCVSRRGLPQPLTDRRTGEAVTISDPWTSAPWTRNWYYPSPQMHALAARALEPACREAAGLAPGRRDWRTRWGQAREAPAAAPLGDLRA